MNTIYLVSCYRSLTDVLDGFATSVAGLKQIVENHLRTDEIEITIDFPNKTILAVGETQSHHYHIHVIRRAT